MSYVKQIKITKIEERPNDAWYDMSLRQLRHGEVCFYRIHDFLTGNWLFKAYEEATGKTAPGKHWVTLTKAEDEKASITLFLLERAWTLSTTTAEEKLEALQQQERQKPKIKKKEIDTGQALTCPVCGDKFRLKHIEKDVAVKHALGKQ